MSNLPLINWHAQELYKLLSEDPNDAILADVYVQLESRILNNTRFKNINATPPNIRDETAESNNE